MDGRKPNTPEDDYQAASKATAEEQYEEYTSHGVAYTAPRPWFRIVGIVLAGLVLLGVLGFGAYWLFMREDKAADSNKSATDTPAASQAGNENEAAISSETEHHVSQGFMLEFDYPSDWKVQEATGSGKLTAISPTLRLKSAEGKPITGQIVFSIRNKQQPMPEFDKGNAMAARESEKITYTKPSSVQRGSTYLSFLRYASDTAPTGLDGIFITGDVGYQKDQAIPKADFVPVDPVISVAFLKCADSSCGSATETNVDVGIWQDEVYAKPIRTMLQSLIVN